MYTEFLRVPSLEIYPTKLETKFFAHCCSKKVEVCNDRSFEGVVGDPYPSIAHSLRIRHRLFQTGCCLIESLYNGLLVVKWLLKFKSRLVGKHDHPRLSIAQRRVSRNIVVCRTQQTTSHSHKLQFREDCKGTMMRPLYIAILLALVPLALSSSVCVEGSSN